MNYQDNFYFKVFVTPSDRSKWEKHIEYATLCPDEAQSVRDEWVFALKFLQKELGNGFLKSPGVNHQLCRCISEKSPLRTREVIRLATTLMRLKESDSNYSKLQSKLTSPQAYKKEGLPFIDIASMYIPEGFSVSFVEEIPEKKTPDIQLIHNYTGDRLFIEVSSLEESAERIALDINFRRLYNILEFPESYMPYSCNQLTQILPEEMDTVLLNIKSAKKTALEQGKIIHYKDEKIRLAVAPMEQYEELMAWIEQHDYRKGLSGAPLNFNETNRIASKKINLKSKQIPPDALGLLYIPVNAMYFFNFNFKEAVQAFQKQMEGLENIFGLIIFAEIIDNRPPVSIMVEDNYYIVSRRGGIVSRHIVFVSNPACKHSLKPATVVNLYAGLKWKE